MYGMAQYRKAAILRYLTSKAETLQKPSSSQVRSGPYELGGEDGRLDSSIGLPVCRADLSRSCESSFISTLIVAYLVAFAAADARARSWYSSA